MCIQLECNTVHVGLFTLALAIKDLVAYSLISGVHSLYVLVEMEQAISCMDV